MREVLEDVGRWRSAGEPVALATVVAVWGSAPRGPGARMAITPSGGISGSVSGGCVEGAVVEEARGVLASGRPKLLRFGVTDEEAWAVGLSCGGRLEVFVEPLESPVSAGTWACLEDALAHDRLVALATMVEGPEPGRRLVVGADGTIRGGLGSPELDERGRGLAAGRLRAFGAGREVLNGGVDLFVEALPPRPKLVIVGAGHLAVPLVDLARTLGLRTCVVDPRSAFATRERFPHADELLPVWPGEAFEKVGLNETSHVAVLAHDLKIDVPALSLALRSPARYIGALGSRKTHEKRVRALREAGFSDEEIGRIRSPIGLDLGGRRPEEIAVAILAEIVAAGHGRS